MSILLLDRDTVVCIVGVVCLSPATPPSLGEDETTSVNAITCISHSEILAGGNNSQLKLWDLREDCLRPAKTIVL